MTALEVVGDRLDRRHADVRRKQIVDPANEPARRDLERHVSMRALRRRVHTGIGAARTLDADRRAVDLRQRGLDDLLHAGRIRLRLPPRVSGCRGIGG